MTFLLLLLANLHLHNLVANNLGDYFIHSLTYQTPLSTNQSPYLEYKIKDELLADISAIVVDLKYNRKQGVKICEVQTLNESKLHGYEFLEGNTSEFAERFSQIIHQYQDPTHCYFWNTQLTDSDFHQRTLAKGWQSIVDTQALHSDAQSKDLTNLSNYQGFIYTFRKFNDHKNFYKKFPNFLLIDTAITPYRGDKLKMNLLFSQDPESSQLRPRWNHYPKFYTPSLAEEICQDIGSDILVIKPRVLSQGAGILIVHKEDLDRVLKKLLKKNFFRKDSHYQHYKAWNLDKTKTFIVEEFIPSDPIQVAHLDNKSYAPTMRTIFILTYHQKQMQAHLLGCYWKLPKLSLEESNDLMDTHKSYGKLPYYEKVDSETLRAVEHLLQKGLLNAYQNMIRNL